MRSLEKAQGAPGPGLPVAPGLPAAPRPGRPSSRFWFPNSPLREPREPGETPSLRGGSYSLFKNFLLARRLQKCSPVLSASGLIPSRP